MKTHVLLLISILFFSVSSAQIINFPDANFKARLISASPNNGIASTETPDSNGNVNSYNTIDTNGDGEIQVSEASAIKYLIVSNVNIFNLEGINNFTALIALNCPFSSLTSLNVTGLTNLQFLHCGNNQLSSLNISGLFNLKRLFCFGNSLTSLNFSGLTNLQELSCANNPLTSLNVSGLTNLQRLSCQSNLLTSLNLSGLANLEHLDCQSNSLTSLNVSGLTNLQELWCTNNQLTSLNLSGLTNLEDLNCGSNPLTSLNLSGLTNLRRLICHSNQLTSLNLSGLSNLEQLLCSNNSLTSLNLSGLTNLEALICHNNQLTSLNVSGLTNLQYLDCSNNLLTSLNVSGLTNLQYLDCSNNQLESLFIKTNNLFDWTSILDFQNNPNLQYICADDQDIAFVQQKINEYGYAATCTVNSYCSFTPGGTFYTIQGNNKFDGNSNGCDVTDGFYPNLRFSITDGTISGSLISNASGNYSIPVQVGTHIITPQIENPSYFMVSPTNVTVTFPATASPFIQDFCILPNGVHHDLEVVIIPLVPARPGFDVTYKIKYKNKGTVSENATLVFNYSDSVLDYVSSTLAPTSTGIGLLSWNIGTVIPFQSGEFVVTLNVNSPMETPAVNAGDILSYTATINGLNTDETPIDNTFTLSQIVVNSFDPNDKTCLEGTTINPTMIGEYVHYQIRFENTGTFPAQNVVVKDMIDTTKFDISTLQIVDTSHSCVTKITNPNKVEFIFENINLPFDDATNDGYVVFKIKTNSTLVVGNTISNLANIYFDYNFPIVTNTATSTFQSLANITFNLDNYVSLSPNPTKDVLNINVQDFENIQSISIYNMLGQLVQITTNPSNSINVSDLKAGNYVIKLHIEKGEIIRKFIKE